MARDAKVDDSRSAESRDSLARFLRGELTHLVRPPQPDPRAAASEPSDDVQQLWQESPELNSPLLLPGSFNPLHEGHRAMAAAAAARLDQPIHFEISVKNVDKPTLKRAEVERRARQFRDHPLCLTQAPTFLEKARLFPGATFLVGADTIIRIAEARYYDSHNKEEAFARLAELGSRFLVYGRLLQQRFQTLDELPLPASLRRLCEPIEDFRADISSSEIRRRR